MTTIAYRQGMVAADSQVNEGDSSYCRMKKLHQFKGFTVGGVGDVAAIIRWLDWFEVHGQDWIKQTITPPIYDDAEATIIVITEDGEVSEFSNQGLVKNTTANFYAWGSGRDFAYGARNAVAAACKFDINSSLPIHEVQA